MDFSKKKVDELKEQLDASQTRYEERLCKLILNNICISIYF